MSNDRLARDEAKQNLQHETAKATVQNEVNAQIESNVANTTPANRLEVSKVAEDLKQNTIVDIRKTESSLKRAKVVTRVSQVIDYLFYLCYGVIGLEILLDVMGASNSNGFRKSLHLITAPLLMPFNNLLPNPSVGHFTLMISYVVALVVYILIHLAINGLLRLLVQKKTAI